MNMDTRHARPGFSASRIAVAALLVCAGTAFAAPDDVQYSVVPGDTLTGVGQRLLKRPTDWQKLQRLNGIENPDRLSPQQQVAIPLKLLRRVPADARLIHLSGAVQSAGEGLATGARIAEDKPITTDENSFATLKMPDGSVVRLQPRSTLRIVSNRQLGNTSAYDIRLELKTGRMESDVSKVKREGGKFEISAPLGTVGIRGTSLRVATDGATSSAVELTEGKVVVASNEARTKTSLNAGNGWLLNAGEHSPRVVPLLPAPDTGRIAGLYERVKVGLPIVPQEGAAAYRTQIASDAQFSQIVAETVVDKGDAKFAGLDDGQYWVRIRAIDRNGIEGRDGHTSFVLKARPEPPFAATPVNGGKVAGAKARFGWSASDVAAYRFQLARDPEFSSVLVSADDLHATEFESPESLDPGEYYWRVGSIRGDGDKGPFGDPQHFTLRPVTQANPAVVADGEVVFGWSGEPGQVFDFELASDAGFENPIESRHLEEPRVVLPKPWPGTYYMRVRPIDADGFVGPYSATQRFEVSPPWWVFLVLLAPFL